MKDTKQLTIRGISSQTKVRLEQAARKNNVSLNKYLQQELTAMTARKHKPTFTEYINTSNFVLDDTFDARLCEQRIIEPSLWQN